MILTAKTRATVVFLTVVTLLEEKCHIAVMVPIISRVFFVFFMIDLKSAGCRCCDYKANVAMHQHMWGKV